METLRSAVLIACGAGIVSCIVGSAAVGSGKKAILNLMINCAALISLISPFTNTEAFDTVNLADRFGDPGFSSGDAEKRLRDYNVRSAELSLELELEKLLKSRSIDIADTVIICEMNEYDEITVSKAEVTVRTKADADKVRSLSGELSKDFPLTVTVSDEE